MAAWAATQERAGSVRTGPPKSTVRGTQMYHVENGAAPHGLVWGFKESKLPQDTVGPRATLFTLWYQGTHRQALSEEKTAMELRRDQCQVGHPDTQLQATSTL